MWTENVLKTELFGKDYGNCCVLKFNSGRRGLKTFDAFFKVKTPLISPTWCARRPKYEVLIIELGYWVNVCRITGDVLSHEQAL